MITEYKKKNISEILHIINNAALKYRGIIPDNCWHEPYMLPNELANELDNGVRIFGYNKYNKLIGVMGIQELKSITLIRHAYILTNYQRMGIGYLLMQYLFKINTNSSLLVGTWSKAIWAIQFYESFGFSLQTKSQTINLLKKYWKISANQIENSVVLKK